MPEELILPERFTRNSDGIITVTESLPERMSFRDDITVLPADDPDKLRLGWIVREEIGIVVINDYAITQISLTEPDVEQDVEPEPPQVIDIDRSYFFEDSKSRFELMEIKNADNN